jgi:hypothetical protein
MKIRVMAVVLTVALSFVATTSTVQAKVKHKHHNAHRVIRDVTPRFAVKHHAVKHHTLSAKRHTRRHVSRRGACDGFHRCRCGTTAARRHGLPYSYNGLNLKKASEWYAFPHTSFGVGVVGVAPHHVLTVIGGSSCSTATVYDDAGTYQRNVCNMTFVSVSSGNIFASSKTHKRSKRIHYAAADDYMNRVELMQ